MHRVLALREYERASIGDRWDPQTRMVSREVAARLEALQARQDAEFLSFGRRTLQAQQYVGTVGLGDCAIDLLPKVDQRDDARVRAQLVSMLAVAGIIPDLEAGTTGLASHEATLLDAYLATYTRKLVAEWRRGPIRDYQREDRRRDCLRGKLLVARQIRESLRDPMGFHTRADELIHDVPLTRVLKRALEICRRHAVSHAIRQEASGLLQDFAHVGESRAGEAERVIADRRHARFAPLLELARLLIRGASPDRAGAAMTYSLVFDMNVVFERYVGRLLARLCTGRGLTASMQHEGSSLLLLEGRPKFRLRPDVAIHERDRLRCLIDTKWKRLDPEQPNWGISQADMYQMYAYGKEYACPRVVLVYPRFGELPLDVATYRHHPGEASSLRIDVRCIEVGAGAARAVRDMDQIVSSGRSREGSSE